MNEIHPLSPGEFGRYTLAEAVRLVQGASARALHEREREAARIVADAALRGVDVSMGQLMGPEWMLDQMRRAAAQEEARGR